MAEEKKSSKKTLIIVLIIVVVLLLAGGVSCIALKGRGGDKPEESGASLTSEGTIPYEQNIGIVTSGQNLEDAVKEDADNKFPLHFSTTATSSDGENFTCVLGNSEGAKYDIYFDMYADPDFTEQVFISGLIPPGSQLESFKTSKKFPEGNTEVFLVVTLVDDDHKTLINQTAISITLVVS